jgi:hypothetical protein
VTCTVRSDCEAFGSSFECVSGRCRALTDAGAERDGGGGNGGHGGAAGDAGQIDAAIDSGTDAGTDAGRDASVAGNCDTAGDTCCDPFPQDGPNFCSNARLICGASNTCEVDCGCALGAYFPVCGVDGQSYDATCGNECVPMEIACTGECPCEAGYCAAACTGAAPDQEVVDACQAIGEQAACQSYESGGFPTGCRWVTPSNASCPLVPGMP